MAAQAEKQSQWNSDLELTPFQALVLMVPEQIDLFLGGGRNSGKSHTIALLMLRGAEVYQRQFRALFVRRTFPGIRDFENVLLDVFTLAYGSGAFSYSKADHIFTLPTGAVVELNQIENEADYTKFQGRSFTFLAADETTQYADFTLLDRLRSNLRAKKGIPLRTVFAANPGGPGHQAHVERYILPSRPWQPFHEKQTGTSCMYCPSTFRDNPLVDRNMALRQIRAAAAGDKALYRAWKDGDWMALQAGAYFSSVLSFERNRIAPWPLPGDWLDWSATGWRFWIAHDLGWAAPSVTYVVAKSPGGFGPDGRYYPAGSIVLVDELATHVPGSLTQGQELVISELCEQIRSLCARWHIRPRGVADDQIMALRPGERNTYQEEYAKFGVHLTAARKGDRVSGWVKLKTLMKNASNPELPGLYVTRRCTYFWNTVPNLQRAARNPEDLEKCSTDHAADAARYAVLERDGPQGGLHVEPLGL